MKKQRRNSNSNFQKGVIICHLCGKHTRDTGRGESDLTLCADCIDCWEWANGIIDGTYTLEDIPENKREKIKKFL